MRSLFVFFLPLFFLLTLVCNDINAVSGDIAAAAAAAATALMIYSCLNKCRRARGTAVNGEGV